MPNNLDERRAAIARRDAVEVGAPHVERAATERGGVAVALRRRGGGGRGAASARATRDRDDVARAEHQSVAHEARASHGRVPRDVERRALQRQK